MREKGTSVLEVNVLWRTLLTLFLARRARRRNGRRMPTEVFRLRVRTLPTDIDLLRHMNNGRYLSLFDLGRWDMLVRTDLLDQMRAHDWYSVVSNETITFRKSLQLWQRFDLETRFVGHDEKALYLEHRAVVRGEIYARALVRARIVRRAGGTVPHDEFFAAVGMPEGIPDVPQWIHDWAAASALPPSKAPAPSVWQ